MGKLLLASIIVASATTMYPQVSDTPMSGIRIGYTEEARHRVGHRTALHNENTRGGFDQIRIDVQVSTSGRVMQARPRTGDPKLWPAAVELASQWQFTPFERGGRAVQAVLQEYLAVYPLEIGPVHRVDFPKIPSLDGVKIKLERSGCMGNCPAYEVQIFGDGLVQFEGGGAVPGRHQATIPAERVQALVDKFREADFFSLKTEYVANITDSASSTLTFSVLGKSMRVHDYVGELIGMPSAVHLLEEAVDEAAGTARWLTTNDSTLHWLDIEHFNLKGSAGRMLLAEAVANDNIPLVKALLARGISMNTTSTDERPSIDLATGLTPSESTPLLVVAARSASPEMLRALIASHASLKAPGDKNHALITAAGKGSVEDIRQLIDYGADPDYRDDGIMGENRGQTVLMAAAGSGNPEAIREILSHNPHVNATDVVKRTALYRLADLCSDNFTDEERAQGIRSLLEAGASVNSRNESGDTPLHAACDVPVAVALIKSGADVNARNDEGETPLFTTYDLEVVKELLKYGADPSLTDRLGRTALEAGRTDSKARAEIINAAIAARNK